MNSHSSRSGGLDRPSRQEMDEDLELTGILNLHPEGSEFQPRNIVSFPEALFQPVDLQRLKREYPDSSEGRRAGARYCLRVTVLICNHQKAFRTQTENVSYSGLLTKDQLPETFQKGFFDVLLIDESQIGKKQYVLFRGTLVDGASSTRRVRFEAFGADAERKLTALFSEVTQAS